MPTVFAQIFHTLRAPQIGNPSPDTHDITAAILQRRTTPLGKSAPASIASDTNTRSSAGSYVAMTSGQVSESSTDPEATPKAKPSALPPPSRADSKYAQALARFPCYSDAEFPKTLRDRHINHYSADCGRVEAHHITNKVNTARSWSHHDFVRRADTSLDPHCDKMAHSAFP
ncbi:hypothetical protein C8Q73DRAFT_363382 [Cubamyces lactineus]|nr:hypothetical protein C8Q73DRAFT_363382 [Cubamyces lactineus]